MSVYQPKLNKFPLYSLPKLYGWHMIAKQDLQDTGKLLKFFGGNWWDVLFSGQLPIHTGNITLKTKNAHSIIFVNIGQTDVKMTNTITGDVYNVFSGQRSTVNNTFDKEVKFVSSDPKTEIHLSYIGSVWLVFLQLQEIKEGKNIRKSVIFTDYLLMSGVPDTEQYLNTVGIENMDYAVINRWKFEGIETGIKSDFVNLLLEQWATVNPTTRSAPKVGIPEKIHFIWLRKDPHAEVYGPLKKKFYKFIDTWITQNPTFEVNLWTDNPNFVLPKQFEGKITIRGPEQLKKILDNLPDNVRSNIKYLAKNHMNPAARSDTLRQVILYFEGGIYADINDSVCLVPLKKMLKKYDYIIGLEPVIYVNNAIIASVPHHVITQHFISWLAYHAKKYVVEWERDYKDAEMEERDDYIVSTTGPIAMTQVLFGILKDDKTVEKLNHTIIFPSSWVYPNYDISQSADYWLKPVSCFAHYDGREFLKKN